MTLIDEGRVGVCYLRVDCLAWNMESQIQTFYQVHSGSFLDCRPMKGLVEIEFLRRPATFLPTASKSQGKDLLCKNKGQGGWPWPV